MFLCLGCGVLAGVACVICGPGRYAVGCGYSMFIIIFDLLIIAICLGGVGP